MPFINHGNTSQIIMMSGADVVLVWNLVHCMIGIPRILCFVIIVCHYITSRQNRIICHIQH